jgi:hypothetical protein
MYFNDYLIYAIIPLLISMWAQYKVQSAFSTYSKVATQTGITGAEAARQMLDARGLSNVQIERVAGNLSDHYDPGKRILRLSENVYGTNSVAAVGVACHEAGHAYQHADSYAWLTLRTGIVPIVNIGSRLGPMIFMAGLILTGLIGQFGYTIATLGLIIFGITAIFSLITLPVEFNASNRAKAWIDNANIMYTDEEKGVSKVLSAAALTYIAAAISSIANILYYASLLNRRNRR